MLNYSENSLDSSSLDALISSSKKSNQNFRNSVYEEIENKSFDAKMISGIYKSILRNLIAEFSTIFYINDQEDVIRIPCWHGNSERVISKLKQESNIVLPVISVFRVNDSSSEGRRRIESIVYETYFDKLKNRAVRVASLAPVATDITYKINIWTKYYEDMDQIHEQIKKKFNPHLIVTDNNFNAVAFLEEEEQNIDSTVADGQDRIIRRTFNLTLETYIDNPKFVITNTGKIERINNEIHFPI